MTNKQADAGGVAGPGRRLEAHTVQPFQTELRHDGWRATFRSCPLPQRAAANMPAQGAMTDLRRQEQDSLRSRRAHADQHKCSIGVTSQNIAIFLILAKAVVNSNKICHGHSPAELLGSPRDLLVTKAEENDRSPHQSGCNTEVE